MSLSISRRDVVFHRRHLAISPIGLVCKTPVMGLSLVDWPHAVKTLSLTVTPVSGDEDGHNLGNDLILGGEFRFERLDPTAQAQPVTRRPGARKAMANSQT